MKKKEQENLPAVAEKASDEQQDITKKVQQVILKTGHAQAFFMAKHLFNFLGWKAIQAIADNKEVLKKMGFSTIDEYFEAANIKRRTGYNNLKIARNLSEEEIKLFAQIGLTRKDLLAYAKLPEEDRLKIKEGRIINLEKADRLEIRRLFDDLLEEHKEEINDQKKLTKEATNKAHSFEILMKQQSEEMKKLMEELPKIEGTEVDQILAYASYHFDRFSSYLDYLRFEKMELKDGEMVAKMGGELHKWNLRVLHKIDELEKYKEKFD